MIDSTQRRLFKYLASERVHPALLLIGNDRESKFRLAVEMAAFLLCSAKKGESFCGECSHCRKVFKFMHPDFLVFGKDAEGDEEEQLKTESVREMAHHMSLSPHEGQLKICVIDEAHRMNANAQNALLKTLEEPGDGRHFILLSTQPGRLLPTVLSRCLEFSFKPEAEGRLLSPEERTKYLSLLQQGAKEKSYVSLTEELGEKTDVLQFVRALQFEMREQLVNGKAIPITKNHTPENVTRLFDQLVELEGKLRSNANPQLMLQSYLETNF